MSSRPPKAVTAQEFELCGLRWSDIDLPSRTPTVAQQITSIGGKLCIAPPKSRASRRTVALEAR